MRGASARACFYRSGWMLCAAFALAQAVPVVTGDARVDKLLSQMTLQEKLTLIHGTHEDPAVYQGQAGYLAGVPRLGIPGLRFADGPPGVLTRHPSQGETATMGVAATFSTKDAEDERPGDRPRRPRPGHRRLAAALRQHRSRSRVRPRLQHLRRRSVPHRQMGVAEVKGIQSQHVMAQIKHYVGYDSNSGKHRRRRPDAARGLRRAFDAASQGRRLLHHVLLQPLNGTFACGNDSTLTKILRDEIGFKGFVTSDWGATHAVNFINAGLDMEMPGVSPAPWRASPSRPSSTRCPLHLRSARTPSRLRK